MPYIHVILIYICILQNIESLKSASLRLMTEDRLPLPRYFFQRLQTTTATVNALMMSLLYRPYLMNLLEYSNKQVACFILPGNLYAQKISCSYVVYLLSYKKPAMPIMRAESIAEFSDDNLYENCIL